VTGWYDFWSLLDYVSKTNTSLSQILCRRFLKAFADVAHTTSWSSLFHQFITWSEKKWCRRLVLLLFFYNRGDKIETDLDSRLAYPRPRLSTFKTKIDVQDRLKTYKTNTGSPWLGWTVEWWTLRLRDSLPTVWSFRLLDISPTGHFAYETFRLLDSSPIGQFAYWTYRLQIAFYFTNKTTRVK